MGPVHQTLTGLWSGRYWYSLGWPPEVEFIATMTEDGGALGGWISEPDSVTNSGQRLSAFLVGSASGADISFAKTYDGAGALAHRVDYHGVISEDRCTIAGQWGLDTESGGFIMSRPALAELGEQVEETMTLPEAVR